MARVVAMAAADTEGTWASFYHDQNRRRNQQKRRGISATASGSDHDAGTGTWTSPAPVAWACGWVAGMPRSRANGSAVLRLSGAVAEAEAAPSRARPPAGGGGGVPPPALCKFM
jgi:hypothetical protein